MTYPAGEELPLEVPREERGAHRLPVLSPEQRLAIRRSTARYIQMARAAHGVPIPMPTISFDVRGRAGGLCSRQDYGRTASHIAINPILFQANQEEFFSQIIGHEVAHAVVNAVYAGKRVDGHGREWKAVMAQLGLLVETTHSMDVSEATIATAQYRFACGCQEFQLSPRKVVEGLVGKRICTRCKTVLTYKGEAFTKERGWHDFSEDALLRKLKLVGRAYERFVAMRKDIAEARARGTLLTRAELNKKRRQALSQSAPPAPPRGMPTLQATRRPLPPQAPPAQPPRAPMTAEQQGSLF